MASTISSAITFAVSSLQALNKQIGLTSDNISNANNENYNFVTVGTQSQAQGGVLASAAIRSTDDVLQRAELSATSIASKTATEQQLANTIEGALGTTNGQTILVDKMQKFQNAWQDFQASPEIVGVEKAVQNAGEDLANELHRLNDFLNENQVKWNIQIRDQITQLNTILKDIYQLNFDIQYAAGHNGQTTTLENQRDTKLVELAKYIKFKTYRDTNNSLLIYNDSTALVSNNYAQFQYNEATQEIKRTDIKLDDDYARRLGGGSLESLLLGVSQRAIDVANTNPNVAIVEKTKTRLEALMYEFKESSLVHSDFSTKVTGAGSDKVIQNNNGLQAGTLHISLRTKSASNLIDPLTKIPTTNDIQNGINFNFTIDSTTTVDQLRSAITTFVTGLNTNSPTAPRVDLEWTGRGQLIVKSSQGFDPNSQKIVIIDNSGLFSSNQTIKELVYNNTDAKDDNFARAYLNSATTAGRNELDQAFVANKLGVSITATTPFSDIKNVQDKAGFFVSDGAFGLGAFKLNPLFSDRIDPPSLKRLSANPIVDSLNSNTRSIINSGINIQNQSYLDVASGLINNVLTQSKVISDNAKQYEKVRSDTQIQLRQKVGVNLDVELSRLTVYQNSYAATARVISVSTELMNELLGLLR